MDQQEKVRRFADLHVKGSPIILFNIWDAGSALAVAEAGAKAIATGSWSVAAANGFADGEELSLDAALKNLERITASVDLPVTIDLEGGYATDIRTLKSNISRVIGCGAIGINFEDQIVGGDGLYAVDDQAGRIATVRDQANSDSVPLFINARTDIFLRTDPGVHHDHLSDAIERSIAYSQAGASGFFVPGLRDPELIRSICEASPVPVNVMVMADSPSNRDMAALGVSRISYGPGPYRQMMEELKASAARAFSRL